MKVIAFKNVRCGDYVAEPGDFDRVIIKIYKGELWTKYPKHNQITKYRNKDIKFGRAIIWRKGE